MIYLIVVEEFTDAKIERFGQPIINKIVDVCDRYAIVNKVDNDVNINKSK